MNYLLKYIKKLITSYVFPEICIGCEKEGQSICRECQNNIITEKEINENLRATSWIFSPLSYKNEILRKALFFLKYHHTKSVAKYLAKLSKTKLKEVINEAGAENKENLILIPIPISKKRLIERDYNQSEILLRELLKSLKEEGLDLEENFKKDLLQKEKHTIKFANTHSRQEREKLIENAFLISPKYDQKFLKEKKIILIDDITTTGATFYEARKTLEKSGVKRENIYGFAVAH
ncbi:MAG: hypothetical protein RI945_354 [Candidatus Parcubacteria bacterium]|jgi:ComF family protein